MKKTITSLIFTAISTQAIAGGLAGLMMENKEFDLKHCNEKQRRRYRKLYNQVNKTIEENLKTITKHQAEKKLNLKRVNNKYPHEKIQMDEKDQQKMLENHDDILIAREQRQFKLCLQNKKSEEECNLYARFDGDKIRLAFLSEIHDKLVQSCKNKTITKKTLVKDLIKIKKSMKGLLQFPEVTALMTPGKYIKEIVYKTEPYSNTKKVGLFIVGGGLGILGSVGFYEYIYPILQNLNNIKSK